MFAQDLFSNLEAKAKKPVTGRESNYFGGSMRTIAFAPEKGVGWRSPCWRRNRRTIPSTLFRGRLVMAVDHAFCRSVFGVLVL
ncbi:MAG TPA: hypothetical protein VHV08_08980, partial [Pirellulales bacterium]|nr:hypothetical protein [Pirellulales bacterium]